MNKEQLTKSTTCIDEKTTLNIIHGGGYL